MARRLLGRISKGDVIVVCLVIVGLSVFAYGYHADHQPPKWHPTGAKGCFLVAPNTSCFKDKPHNRTKLPTPKARWVVEET